MPCELTWEARGFLAKYSGIVSGDDILDVMRALEGNSRFDDLRYGISDYLEVRGHTVVPEQMLAAAAHWRGAARTNPGIILVSVAVDRAVVAAIRAFEGLQLSPYPRAVVASVAEARAWLKAELEGRP